MRLTRQQIIEDNMKYKDRDVITELEYCSEYMRDRKHMTNLDIRFYMWLFRKALAIINRSIKWIPCSEKPHPNNSRYVLVYRPGLHMEIDVDWYDRYWGEDDDEWYEGWVRSGDKVVAWSELPLPYKGVIKE